MIQSPLPISQALPDLVYALIQGPASGTGSAPLFAARASGLFLSEDSGISWRYAYRSLLGDAPLATTSIVVSPGTSPDPILFAGVAGGVLFSNDDGQSWQPCSLPSPAPLVTGLAIASGAAHEGESLFAATAEDGVLCSSDGGRSWIGWNFGLLDMSVTAIAVSPDFPQDHTIYAGTSSGLFTSANSGHSWREMPLPFDFDAVLSLATAPGPVGRPALLAGTENYGLFRSPDGGETWEAAAANRIESPVNGILLSPDFPRTPEVVLLLGRELLISRDGGESWEGWLQNRLPAGEEITALYAPQGFSPGAPVLLGGMNGIYPLQA